MSSTLRNMESMPIYVPPTNRGAVPMARRTNRGIVEIPNIRKEQKTKKLLRKIRLVLIAIDLALGVAAATKGLYALDKRPQLVAAEQTAGR